MQDEGVVERESGGKNLSNLKSHIYKIFSRSPALPLSRSFFTRSPAPLLRSLSSMIDSIVTYYL
jgi:hypothetical protein